MTQWDPNMFRDSSGEEHHDAESELELPLELYFAEDRTDPDAVAARASLESDVLDRVGSERGFVSRRERKLIKVCRGVALSGVFCVLLAAAVADRLNIAPWSLDTRGKTAGPVSGLVSSTTYETTVTIERAIDLRDRLLRAVEPAPMSKQMPVMTVTFRPAPSKASSTIHAPIRQLPAGPYLTAEGFGVAGTSSLTTMIRFEDGFSVPAMACDSTPELRWPASREVTTSVVSFDGGISSNSPTSLSPVWYANQRSDHSR